MQSRGRGRTAAFDTGAVDRAAGLRLPARLEKRLRKGNEHLPADARLAVGRLQRLLRDDTCPFLVESQDGLPDSAQGIETGISDEGPCFAAQPLRPLFLLEWGRALCDGISARPEHLRAIGRGLDARRHLERALVVSIPKQRPGNRADALFALPVVGNSARRFHCLVPPAGAEQQDCGVVERLVPFGPVGEGGGDRLPGVTARGVAARQRLQHRSPARAVRQAGCCLERTLCSLLATPRIGSVQQDGRYRTEHHGLPEGRLRPVRGREGVVDSSAAGEGLGQRPPGLVLEICRRGQRTVQHTAQQLDCLLPGLDRVQCPRRVDTALWLLLGRVRRRCCRQPAREGGGIVGCAGVCEPSDGSGESADAVGLFRAQQGPFEADRQRFQLGARNIVGKLAENLFRGATPPQGNQQRLAPYGRLSSLRSLSTTKAVHDPAATCCRSLEGSGPGPPSYLFEAGDAVVDTAAACLTGADVDQSLVWLEVGCRDLSCFRHQPFARERLNDVARGGPAPRGARQPPEPVYDEIGFSGLRQGHGQRAERPRGIVTVVQRQRGLECGGKVAGRDEGIHRLDGRRPPFPRVPDRTSRGPARLSQLARPRVVADGGGAFRQMAQEQRPLLRVANVVQLALHLVESRARTGQIPARGVQAAQLDQCRTPPLRVGIEQDVALRPLDVAQLREKEDDGQWQCGRGGA